MGNDKADTLYINTGLFVLKSNSQLPELNVLCCGHKLLRGSLNKTDLVTSLTTATVTQHQLVSEPQLTAASDKLCYGDQFVSFISVIFI